MPRSRKKILFFLTLFTFSIAIGVGLLKTPSYSVRAQTPVREIASIHAIETVPSKMNEMPEGITEAVTEAKNEEEKLNELQEIFDSRNDNDPRLDLDFKILTDNEKKMLQEKYINTKPENLNERGTLVFLIGRNISSKEDLKFLEKVLDEDPCLDAKDCKKAKPKVLFKPTEADVPAITEMTLVYPQAVSVKALETYARNPDANADLRNLAISNLKRAKVSKSPLVADLAKIAVDKISP